MKKKRISRIFLSVGTNAKRCSRADETRDVPRRDARTFPRVSDARDAARENARTVAGSRRPDDSVWHVSDLNFERECVCQLSGLECAISRVLRRVHVSHSRIFSTGLDRDRIGNVCETRETEIRVFSITTRTNPCRSSD